MRSNNSRLRMEGFNLICLRAPPRLLERVGLRKNMWVLLRAMLAHRESQCEPKLESMPPHVVGVVYNFDPTTPFRERHIRLNRSVHRTENSRSRHFQHFTSTSCGDPSHSEIQNWDQLHQDKISPESFFWQIEKYVKSPSSSSSPSSPSSPSSSSP